MRLLEIKYTKYDNSHRIRFGDSFMCFLFLDTVIKFEFKTSKNFNFDIKLNYHYFLKASIN